MFSPYKLLRRCLLATSCLSLLFPVTAQAQNAVIPSRVGQITSLSGNVSYNGAGSGGQWIQVGGTAGQVAAQTSQSILGRYQNIPPTITTGPGERRFMIKVNRDIHLEPYRDD